MNLWKWYIKPILSLTLPWTPRGRQLRIEHVMEVTGGDRAYCTYIVYMRDLARGYKLTALELEELDKITRPKFTQGADKMDIVICCTGGCGRTTEGMTWMAPQGEFRQVDESGVPEWTCPVCLKQDSDYPENADPGNL